MLGALRHRIRTNNAWIECEGKGVCEKNGAGVFQTEEHPSPRAMLNDNTTQMSVPIVGNKSLSSYDCATKLGPSDSLITSLSWVCLCCPNCCLPGPTTPPPPATVAGETESHNRAEKALDPTQHVSSSAPPDRKGQPSGPAKPSSGPIYTPMLRSCQPLPHSSF